MNIAYREDGAKSSAAKFLSEADFQALRERLGANAGDLALIVADPDPMVVAKALGELRVLLGRRLGLARKDVHALCWVVEFPLLEWSARGAALDGHAPPVHVRNGRGLGPAGDGPWQGARKGV